VCVSPDPRTQQHDTRRTVRDVQRGEAKHRAVGAARRRNLRRKPNMAVAHVWLPLRIVVTLAVRVKVHVLKQR
jgi:hypothetical protein